tara:strand:- start:4876 stop:6456 length:1581 start_codon:yes stop_codon:yes gene_type:complete
MSVQLPTSPVRFPTAQRTRRTPEPTTKEKLAGLAPLLVQGLGGLFGGEDTPRTPEQYAMDELGLTEQQLLDGDLNKFQQARLDAYNVYGEVAPKDDFGWDEIANIAAASMMDRGAGDYVTTYLALKKDAKAKEATKEISRADFIKSRTDANLQFKSFQDTVAANAGSDDRRVGYFDPDSGISYVPNDNGEGFIDIREHPGNWIPIADVETEAPTEDPMFKDFKDLDSEILTKEAALVQTQTTANKLVEVFDQAKKQGLNPLTVVSSIGTFFNDVNANVQNLGGLFGGDILNGFATVDDVSRNLAGSYGRSGSGQAAQQLQAILRDSSKTDTEIQEAINKFRDTADVDGSYSLGEVLKELSYLDVRAQGTMLQLAYMLAAANGQTGRTLSDKDLAYHLQMLGSGATQDIDVARRNLIEVIDTVGEGVDNEIALRMGPQISSRYDLNDDKFVNILRGYWRNPSDDWTNPNDYMTVENLKTFEQRYSKTIPAVATWYSHTGRGSTKNPFLTSEDVEKEFSEEMSGVGDL